MLATLPNVGALEPPPPNRDPELDEAAALPNVAPPPKEGAAPNVDVAPKEGAAPKPEGEEAPKAGGLPKEGAAPKPPALAGAAVPLAPEAGALNPKPVVPAPDEKEPKPPLPVELEVAGGWDVPEPPKSEVVVVLGVPKADEVAVLPPKTFLLALSALGAAPSPLKNPPPPPLEEPNTLVVEPAALVVAVLVAGAPALPLPPNMDF